MSKTPHQNRLDNVDYRSVDSAPERLSAPVAIWRAPAMLLAFCSLAVFQLWLLSGPAMGRVFANYDYVLSPYDGHHSIAIRVYVISFYIAFAIFAAGKPFARFLFGLDLLVSFALLCAALDLGNALFTRLSGLPYSIDLVQIIAGLLGFALFSFKLLERGNMPTPVRVASQPFRLLRSIFRLFAVIILSGTLSFWVGSLKSPVVEALREITLLGGIGPGVLLFLPLVFGMLYILGVIERRLTASSDFNPPLTVIIPAFNEAHIIDHTIESIDLAAAHYGAPVHILIMNNGSQDDTVTIANQALSQCNAASGEVLNIPTPGKAYALNAGLAAVRTEFVVRVDADTQLREDNLALAMENFADDSVGVVGGIPIPPGGGLFDRPRMVEVLVKHGFYSVALGAVNGLIGIPGMFVAYRTEQTKQLNGFATGMNGEDTDMSLRIAELGFRSVVDSRVRYISEVPATVEHMQEQRMRWFRSVYHVSARCRELIYSDALSVRGKIILPYMMLNSGRRAMMVPMIFFGTFQYLGASNPAAPLVWQAIAAVMIGAPAVLAVASILLNNMPKALLAMPEYVLFRILRAYFTLQSTLSINLAKQRTDMGKSLTGLSIPNIFGPQYGEPAQVSNISVKA